jgi:LacI family transcriptional regulator
VKKKLSIVDIANSLNVSKTTISFILNGRAQEKRIGAELVERVLKYVEEVGYKPNPLAKSLRTGKSNIIGLMVEDIANPFFANIARLIEDRAYKNGYKIIYCSTDNNTEKTKDLIEMYHDRRVDGYIIAPPEGIEDDINSLIKTGFPVVLFDRNLENVNADYVVVDNMNATYKATQHLISQGYKNIAYVSFLSAQAQLTQRMQGYKNALKEHNLKPITKEVLFNRDNDIIMDPIRTFLKKRSGDIDAILFGTNHIGVCGLRLFNELGIKVPHDIAVVSFDDYEVFQLFTPPISAIAQPIVQIADNVISTLLNKLNHPIKNKSVKTITLSTELNIRASSAPAKTKAPISQKLVADL